MVTRSALLSLFFTFVLAASNVAAQSVPTPPELMPTVEELPAGFEPQPDRDVDIVGSSWSDSYRAFARPDADAETLGLRISVYQTQSGAEDWLQFSLWSLEREGYATSGSTALGEEAYGLRAQAPDGTVTTGLLFRVGNAVGWTTSHASTEEAALDTALHAAQLLEDRLTHVVASLSN
jgi:hypothetical protein